MRGRIWMAEPGLACGPGAGRAGSAPCPALGCLSHSEGAGAGVLPAKVLCREQQPCEQAGSPQRRFLIFPLPCWAFTSGELALCLAQLLRCKLGNVLVLKGKHKTGNRAGYILHVTLICLEYSLLKVWADVQSCINNVWTKCTWIM